jgi:steroid delta-isomerase-like uncharacterized protein
MNEQPDAVIRTWFEEVWNERRQDTIDRLFAPDGVAHGLPGGPINGPAGFRPLFDAFRGAFPDIHVTVDRTIVQGDMVAAHCTVTGTHTGGDLRIEATGRQVEFQGVTIARIVDGRFGEVWNCFDFLTMYQQLDVVPQIGA